MFVLPSVVMMTSPLVGAVQLHQIELPPILPAWFGSPDSLFAPTFDPVVVMFVPVRMIRLLNRSLAGAADRAS